jgi:hypothetical protein
MKAAIVSVVFALAGVIPAAAQEAPAAAAPAAAAPTQHAFQLQLQPLYDPRYEPARELRLALWDSPMSRLELTAAREQWALRNPGPTGTVIPFEGVQLPLRLHMESSAQSLFLGPWSPSWERLTWQEKVAAGAQTGVLALALVQVLSHIH